MEKKTATVKQVRDLLNAIIKLAPDTPVYLSSDEEGNSYSTIEPWKNNALSSFSVQYDKNNKIKSLVIFPWVEGLNEYDVGLLEKDE